MRPGTVLAAGQEVYTDRMGGLPVTRYTARSGYSDGYWYYWE
jgi:hypothetical protein